MKKKILILMPSMFIGGAERSLLGLLDAMDYTQYEVDLFLFRQEGEFLPHIPKTVRLLRSMWQYTTFDVPIVSLLKSKKVLFGLSRILSKVCMKLHCLFTREKPGVWMELQYISRFLQWLLPPIPGHYDLAIHFLGVPEVLANKVSADVKIAWNHTDYTTVHPRMGWDRQVYEKIDYIASVSQPCTEQLLRVHPELSGKAVTVENILSPGLLQAQADMSATDMKKAENEISILSVGRFCEAKNFDNVPDICRRIRAAGWNVRWYLIGYGTDEALIREKIREAGMEEFVIILGKKENPYCYMRSCDLYVQPSRYEGKCVSVREAQMLGKPVVITNFPTASSQLTDGVDGVVVPMDNAGCATGIMQLLENPEKMEQLIQNCRQNDYSNAEEVEKIYAFLDGSN